MLVFDIDGTLTDTVAVDGECFEESVREVLGLELDGQWARFEQVTDQGILDELLRDRSRADQVELSERLREDFLHRLGERARTEPQRFVEIAGAGALLQRLADQGTEHALATGAWRESALLKLNAAALPYQRLRATSSDTPIRTKIFESVVLPGGPVTLIGDGVWDAKVARQLGWRFIARAEPGPKSEALREAGAVAVVHDWRDVDEGLLLGPSA